jgi:hypothetical protein
MQAYEVRFTPAQRPPLQIADGIRAVSGPQPHVAVGDAAAGQGVEIPLTARLTASCPPETSLIGRANAYRDPKTGRIVLGVEPPENGGNDDRALVLLAAASAFPEGVAVTPEKSVTVLAAGEVRNGRQMLLIWPEGGQILISDPGRDEQYALCRTGDQFAPVLVSDGF